MLSGQARHPSERRQTGTYEGEHLTRRFGVTHTQMT